MVSATRSAGGRVIRRPRMTPDREAELLLAVLDVLREVGYAGLSMEVVAARAGCGKATLYRLWQSKAGLVVAALRAVRPMADPGIDTGSVRGDLQAIITQLMSGGDDVVLLAAVHHAVLTDEDMAAVVRSALRRPVAELLQCVVDRAVERGELTARPAAAEFLPQLMFSLFMVGPFDGVLVDAEFLARFVDHVLLPALRHWPERP